MKKFIKFFSPFEWFLLVAIIALTIISSCFGNETTFAKSFFNIRTLSAIAGVVNVVLAAKGHISNFLFGILQCGIYAYCCFIDGVWGNAFLFALYFLPMQFIGFFSWKKNLKSDGSNEVKTRLMNLKQSLITYSITVVAVVGLYFVLKSFNGDAAVFDAASTIFNIVAMILMVKGFADQWYLWILVNIASCLLWATKTIDGDQGALIFAVMWFVYLLNAIHGLIVWRKNAKEFDGEYK